MKIIKYIIFLSVLGGTFLIVYRNCDSKGLRRCWASLKMAIIIAATSAGLIPSLVEANEPHVSNDSPSMERVVKLSGGFQSKFGPDQNQGKGRCKSEVQETKTYNIKSQIGNHKKLTKISNKIRKNPKLVQEFNGLEQKLRNGNMKAGRGVKPLSDSNGICYARGYTEGARLYFKYSEDNIIVLGESNKPTQDTVIEFLLKNY